MAKVLRQELEPLGHRFRGTSDTEVLLAAFSQWGLEATLPKLNGMFALALWDRQERPLGLARDRYGKKPLYYGKARDMWAFASELKALRKLDGFRADINHTALGEFLRLAYVPAPLSIYNGTKKLPPASYCWLPQAPRSYWSLAETARQQHLSTPAEIEAALLRSVKRRMLSDVHLGAFLSGGIDSSLVVAMMQEQCSRPIKTLPASQRRVFPVSRGVLRGPLLDWAEHLISGLNSLITSIPVQSL